MKIIDAKLQVVEVPLPHPFPSTWNPGNPETKLFVTIAEIITDDGIHGYGAACDSSQLLAGIWDTHIRPLVIGKEITQVEAINTGLVNASLYAYRPWCVEVAVWDALGKYANLPIYKMLGGVQDKVLAYASTGSLKSVEERVEDAERYIAEGFKMMKLRAHHDDPFEDVRIIAEIKKLYESDLPIFGVCMGHQLLALATGAQTRKMRFGHRGANHPVRDVRTGRTQITSQNHGYVVTRESVDPAVAEISHVNVNEGSVEGLEYKRPNCFSVQFHPEAAPGPKDTKYLFNRFVDMMKGGDR